MMFCCQSKKKKNPLRASSNHSLNISPQKKETSLEVQQQNCPSNTQLPALQEY
jgi:hypothetical protein